MKLTRRLPTARLVLPLVLAAAACAVPTEPGAPELEFLAFDAFPLWEAPGVLAGGGPGLSAMPGHGRIRVSVSSRERATGVWLRPGAELTLAELIDVVDRFTRGQLRVLLQEPGAPWGTPPTPATVHAFQSWLIANFELPLLMPFYQPPWITLRVHEPAGAAVRRLASHPDVRTVVPYATVQSGSDWTEFTHFAVFSAAERSQLSLDDWHRWGEYDWTAEFRRSDGVSLRALRRARAGVLMDGTAQQ
jgi:hypothetical protein